MSEFQFTGDVFTDGSVLAGGRRGHERAGWAAVQVGADGLVVGGAYGTCPDHFKTFKTFPTVPERSKRPKYSKLLKNCMATRILMILRPNRSR